MKYTLKENKTIKIWVTEAVCILFMNSVTTSKVKVKSLKSIVSEELTVCVVSWPFRLCLHNLLSTSLEKNLYIDSQQAVDFPHTATHRTCLWFYNKLDAFYNSYLSVHLCSKSKQISFLRDFELGMHNIDFRFPLVYRHIGIKQSRFTMCKIDQSFERCS